MCALGGGIICARARRLRAGFDAVRRPQTAQARHTPHTALESTRATQYGGHISTRGAGARGHISYYVFRDTRRPARKNYRPRTQVLPLSSPQS